MIHRATGQLISQASFWVAAIVVGILSVLYAELINYVQWQYLIWFQKFPYLLFVISPVFFVIAAALVRHISAEAKGSGIPQVLQAIHLSERYPVLTGSASALISIKTAAVKVFSTALGILGGASVGREGPTVQIAASVFSWIAKRTKRWVPHLDFQSYLVAGGAAGVSAAFNTPLAGVAFALEEIGEVKFPKFKENVMLSVIIAGVSAHALSGDYLYFGHPTLDSPSAAIVIDAILIGIAGGLSGGGFAWILSRQNLSLLPKAWIKRAIFCGLLCAALNLLTESDTSGSGYEVTRKLMDSPEGSLSIFFAFEKFATTILSYLSGMSGGIFSPCLSVGAGLGVTVSKVVQLGNLKTCALIGMVAFFSGVVQAPLTAVIIVMEMTDKHVLIIPLMVAAYLAQAVSKRVMPVPLYRCMAFGGYPLHSDLTHRDSAIKPNQSSEK